MKLRSRCGSRKSDIGTENEQNAVLYMNGNFLGPIKDIQTTILEPESSDESRFLGVDLAQSGDFTATFTHKFPHISRKRFVRNLVKAGCPKKKAKEIAWRVRTSYGYANFLARTAGCSFTNEVKYLENELGGFL